MDKVAEAPKKRFPIHLGFGLLIGCLGWLIPYCGLAITLLPAKIGQIDPSHKVAWVATFSATAMVVAAISNIIVGALSDRTRTKIGKRTPWIIGGTVFTIIFFYLISISTSIQMMLVLYALYQIALNSCVASLAAFIPDRVAPEHRGTASSFVGIAATLGNSGAGLIAAHFIIHINFGIYVFAGVAILFEVIALLLIKEPGNVDEPREKLNKASSIFKTFALPIKGAHDFYLALSGRLMFTSALNMITGFQLYILTDYMHLGTGKTASTISLISTIMLITGVICGVIAGPFADKIGRYKLPVAICMMMVGFGAFFPFFDAHPWTMMVFTFINGIFNGAYNAVDQALTVAVLPDEQTAAKDLGILNLANTLGQIVGPLLAGAIIASMGYKMIFPTVMVICLVGAGLILLIKRDK
ncbi:multidrug-efflux transporter [Paucilactobacillus vaccinostercus DSM 20634]|uniref:Multidrug-efflux transporter n=1 Tax=Paucilactobacillus vaccinostercus DSM 20634 TaxID=1423813 RepID=A0A0R2AEK7_9LACO|nr:MFS transporter [Paucilactobacillus vaccinostercus]KRM62731.1 multidrug-efflux transporter [Paucilactobacillus vaccinostercus DSM 20634]